MTSFLDRVTLSSDRLAALDDQLSKRHIDLDPSGYFVIYLDREAGLICAKHFGIVVNERGLAVDPETGKPLSAKGSIPSPLLHTYSGRTAKELCVQIFEPPASKDPGWQTPVSHFNHAAYLGREFQKAEAALLSGSEYIQD